MSNIKVAYMLGSLNRGGTETLMLDVFRNANKAPFQFIGIHRKGGAYKDDFYAAGPKMIPCAPKRFGLVRYLIQLRRLLKSERVTIVHAQQPLEVIYAYLATIGMNIPIIQTLHGFYPMEGRAGLLTRLSILLSKELCFVSQYEQKWYQHRMKIANDKCHVIYNGIDFLKFDMRGATMKDLEGERNIKLCMVGNFMSGRDHITLTKALFLLHKRGTDNYDFYFIGKRSDTEPKIYDSCKQLCVENNMGNVHFLGARDDVPDLLKSMDGFVYCTDHDTFGIAPIEAMYSGLPVVVNDWPVMKEVCGEDNENIVYFFQSKNIEDCANTIENLLRELKEPTEKFKSRCANNKKWVCERYSIEAYIRHLSNVYDIV